MEIANALGNLRNRVVFIGGAAIPLLLTGLDEAPRATDDVDAIADGVTTRAEWAAIETELRKLGFAPDPDGPVCRFRKKELRLDLMPANASILGFASRWYTDAAQNSQPMTVDGVLLRVASAPYLLATKIEAFLDRGAPDAASSVDLEDIVSIVDGRPELMSEINGAAADLGNYIAVFFGALLDRPDIRSLVAAQLRGDRFSQQRLPAILAMMKALARR